MKKPTKVLYVVSTLKRTGPINLLFDIIKGLDKERFSPSVLTLSPEGQDSKENDFLELGVKVHKVNRSRIGMALWGKSAFRKIVDEINPDVIHGHCLRPDYYVSRCGNGRKTFTTIHNYPHLDYPYLHGRVIGGVMAKVQLDCIRALQFPIACSKAISDELRSKFDIDSKYIANGVDTDRFHPVDSSTRECLRIKFGIPQNARVLISVGWLSERKNPITLIKAFRKAVFDQPTRLIMIGKGDLEAQCIELKDESISTIRYVENLEDYLACADYYISASRAEGMPCSVLQGMACGLPALLSDIPPHREILENSPLAGLLFPGDGEDGLVELFNNLNALGKQVAGNEARRTVETGFSNAIMVKDYQDWYTASLA